MTWDFPDPGGEFPLVTQLRPKGVPVRCQGVSQVYSLDGEDVVALDDVSFEVRPAERVALFGPSGSGKSTLMALLAGLRRPTQGDVWVADHNLSAMSERAILRVRGQLIGIVVQNPSRSLLRYGTAEDNIRFARRARGGKKTRQSDPRVLLAQLGLEPLAGRTVSGMSGGEQQRLSIAVAVATGPGLLLADEPTSQLDSTNRDRTVAVFDRVAEEFGTTTIVITHDPAVADALDRRITLSEGHIVEQSRPSTWSWGG